MKARVLLIAGLITVLVVLALMVWPNAAPVLPPLPNPNGYDDFRQAGGLVTGEVGDYQTLDTNALRQLLATNAESLRLVRLGLTRRCSVHTAEFLTNFAKVTVDLMGHRRLAQLLVAEGRLAEVEGRPGDAMESYLDDIRLGNEVGRGGFLVHRGIGIACETAGLMPLAKLATRLDPQRQRALASELEKADAATPTWHEVEQGERLFARSVTRNPIVLVEAWWQTREIKKRAEVLNSRTTTQLRLLAAECALRAYRFEKAAPPANLDQLVPGYLQRVPIDPFSGKPPTYRVLGTNWLLYSIGPDGVDNGGSR